ncbi:MAG: glycosyltransferase family 9 protein [Verrucomicrobiota bacterium]
MPSLLNRLHAGVYTSVFGWLARRRPPQPAPVELDGDSRVLLFSCAGIGDTLTDSVVFRALKETYPGIHLAAVVHHKRRALLEHNPYVDQIFEMRKGLPAFLRRHGQLSAAGPWSAILQLRGNDPEPRCQSFRLNPDVTFSTPNMTRLSHLCGHQVEQPEWDQTHGVLQTLRLAKAVGAETADPTLVYEVTPEERAILEDRLRRFEVGDRPRLVFQIGGGRRASWRDWPERHWAALAVHLERNEDLDAEIILLGGPDNAARADEVSRMLDVFSVRHHNLCGRLPLELSAALCQSARVVVSTDTGVMHLSFAVGARVVALIHCNNPAPRVGPFGYGDRHRVVQLPKPEGYTGPWDADMGAIQPRDHVAPGVMELWREAGKS